MPSVLSLFSVVLVVAAGLTSATDGGSWTILECSNKTCKPNPDVTPSQCGTPATYRLGFCLGQAWPSTGSYKAVACSATDGVTKMLYTSSDCTGTGTADSKPNLPVGSCFMPYPKTAPDLYQQITCVAPGGKAPGFTPIPGTGTSTATGGKKSSTQQGGGVHLTSTHYGLFAAMGCLFVVLCFVVVWRVFFYGRMAARRAAREERAVARDGRAMDRADRAADRAHRSDVRNGLVAAVPVVQNAQYAPPGQQQQAHDQPLINNQYATTTPAAAPVQPAGGAPAYAPPPPTNPNATAAYPAGTTGYAQPAPYSPTTQTQAAPAAYAPPAEANNNGVVAGNSNNNNNNNNTSTTTGSKVVGAMGSLAGGLRSAVAPKKNSTV